MPTQNLDKKIQTARNQGYTDDQIKNYLKSKGVFAPQLNQVWGKDDGTNLAGKLTGATSLGRYIGGKLFGLTPESKSLDASMQKSQELMGRLDEAIARNKKQGKDTSRLEKEKQNLQMNLQETGYTQEQLQSGGVTGKQAIGSGIQLASLGVPATRLAGAGLKSVGLGSTGVGRGLQTLSKNPGATPFKFGAAEGGLSGAAFGVGGAVEEDKGVGGVVGSAIGEGILGAVGGGTVSKILSKIPGGSKLFADLPNEQARKLGFTGPALKAEPKIAKDYGQKVVKNLNESLGFSSTKKSSTINKELNSLGDLTESDRLHFADNFYNRTQDLQVLNKKGELVDFDIRKATPDQYWDAYLKTRNNLADEIITVYEQVGQEGFERYQRTLADELIRMSGEDKYGPVARKYFADQAQEIMRKNGPRGVYEYATQGDLSKQVSNYFSSASDTVKGDAAARVRNKINAALDDFMQEFVDSTDAQRLRRDLASYKDIEAELDAFFRRSLKDANVEAYDAYGLSNVIAGGIYGNPGQMAKGAAFDIVKLAQQMTGKTDVGNLRKAFQILDDWYKIEGKTRGITPIDKRAINDAYRARTEKGIVPQGEAFGPGSTGQIRIPPRESANMFENVGRSAQSAPANVDDIIQTLPPAQQKQAQEAIDTLKELFGKKKIDNEGFSALNTILAAAGVTGVAAASTIGDTTTYEAPESTGEQEEETGLDVNSIKEQIALRETRGEEQPYDAVNPSDSEWGDALGKYQTRELTLDEWSERFLGRKVSPAEYLKSPELQEQFFESAMLRFQDEYEVTDPEVAMALWHMGWSPKNINKDPEELKKEAQDYLKEPQD